MEPLRTRRIRVLAAALLLAIALFAVLLDQAVSGHYALRAIDDIGQGVAAAVGAVLCAWRARTLSGRWRLSWALVSLGLFGWTAGAVVWSYYELVLRVDVPFPSPADCGYLLFPVCALAGLLVRPAAAYAGSGRPRVLFDGVMVASSLFALGWLTSLGPVFHAGHANRFTLVVSLAYPIGDLVVLTVAALVLIHGEVRAGHVVFCAGMGCIAVADSAFTYLTASGTYQTGSLADIAWVAGFLVVGFAAAVARRTEHEPTRVPSVGAALVMPYALVLVAAGAQVFLALREHLDPISLLATLVAVGALLVRQFLVGLDNRRLAERVLAQRAELAYRAFHDPLTGLANRALFYDRLEHALALHRRDMRPVTVVFVDLDDFKAVNDVHGHGAGDAVLVAVANRLSAAVRAGDTIARLGGDEFAVLVEDEGDSTTLAQRLIDSMALPIVVDGERIAMTASIGTTSLAPEQVGSTVQALLKQADVAMYAAKHGGKARTVRYTDSLASDPAKQRSSTERALAAAVQAGTIDTAFQAIVRLDNDEVLAYEALARWLHRGQSMSPEVFIPMAEHADVLVDLDLLMVRRCLARSRTSRGSDEDVLFTANLGVTRFRERAVTALLARALDEYGVAPHQLVIEISERDMLDSADIDYTVRALRDLGVGIAIDDFGVGWSNLSRLDTLRPDVVKIDRSLVTPLGQRPGARRLLATVVELAHDLGSIVVGEGVETSAQLDVLRELGCDAAQGFLIARPAPWPDDIALGPRPLFGWQRSMHAAKVSLRVPADAT